jgi:hypothetical protein
MKRTFLPILLLVGFAAAAQTTEDSSSNYVVKDSTGFVFAANLWQPLVNRGTHKLVPEHRGDPNTAFFIARKTPGELREEAAAKMANYKKPPARSKRGIRTGGSNP